MAPPAPAAAEEEDGRAALDVVVAHCRSTLRPLARRLRDAAAEPWCRVGAVHVYSRCGRAVDYDGPGRVVVRRTPNVGSCDMVYAAHLAAHRRAPRGGRLTLFVKDTAYNRPPHQGGGAHLRPLGAVAAEAAGRRGFACALHVPLVGASTVWHRAANLSAFRIPYYRGARIASGHADLGAWWARHPEVFARARLAHPHLPACYGGVFAARLPADPPRVAALLDDLRNHEVNHFMERSWALLLLRRLEPPCAALAAPPQPVPSGMRGAVRCI